MKDQPHPEMKISSWDQLRKQIVSIVSELNRDPRLALAAAANPMLALEELGYDVRDEARIAIEDRLRFRRKEASRRARLRDQIFEQIKHPFDLNSPEALRTVLYDELALRPYPDARGCYPELPETHPPRRRSSGTADPDPLQRLKGRHPVIDLLLEYRQLEVAHPGFASKEAYDAIRTGAVETPIRRLLIRFKSQPSPDDSAPGAAVTQKRRTRKNQGGAESSDG